MTTIKGNIKKKELGSKPVLTVICGRENTVLPFCFENEHFKIYTNSMSEAVRQWITLPCLQCNDKNKKKKKGIGL